MQHIREIACRNRRRPSGRAAGWTSGQGRVSPRETFMEPDRTDTNLLFGILAVKMNFIRKEDLFEAMGAWFLDRHRTLGEILVERQALSGTNRNLLDAMVRESQVLQGPAARPGVPEGIDPATRPSESLLPTQAPREDPAAAGENGCAADGEMTVTWSTSAAGGGRGRAIRRDPLARQGGDRPGLGGARRGAEPRGGAEGVADERRDEADSRARFQLEAEVTARLEHPGIVPVYAIGCNAPGRAVLRDAVHQGGELQGGGPAVPSGLRPAGPAPASRGSGSAAAGDSSTSATRSRMRTAAA